MNIQFERLVSWYSSQCDGLWEHRHGFKITTLDNPGLQLRIDLNGTYLQNIEFNKIEQNFSSKNRWLACKKTSDNFFDGCSPPHSFGQVIEIFADWADNHA